MDSRVAPCSASHSFITPEVSADRTLRLSDSTNTSDTALRCSCDSQLDSIDQSILTNLFDYNSTTQICTMESKALKTPTNANMNSKHNNLKIYKTLKDCTTSAGVL